MRHFLRIFMIVMCCTILRIPASALTYVDDFKDSSNNNIKHYSGLTPFPMDAGSFTQLPDLSAFSFSSLTNPVGRATYNVQGAEQVTVGIYSLYGTYVSPMYASAGSYSLGVGGGDQSILTDITLPQARYSSSNGAIYAYIGGELNKACYYDSNVLFVPTSDSPADMGYYGVNIYSSGSGGSLSLLSLSPTRRVFQSSYPFVYEEYTANVSPSATLITVELNDVIGFESIDRGGTVLKSRTRFNCIASVSISGSSLTLGVQEPIISQPIYNSSSSSSSSSSSKSSGKKASSAAGGAAGAGTASVKKSSSSSQSVSKFEGTIRASSSSSPRSKASSSKISSQSQSSATSSEVLPQSDSELDAIYRVASSSNEDNHFTAGIRVYIIVLTGALLFVLLRAAINKK